MTNTYKLFWCREDGQGDMEMGEYETAIAAEAAIPEMEEILLAQCGEDFQIAEVRAGGWEIVEVVEDDD